MSDPHLPYNFIRQAAQIDGTIEQVQIGLTWTSCKARVQGRISCGFAMSPAEKTRLLSWPGTLAGKSIQDLSGQLLSWDNFEATIALAACNAAINCADNSLMQAAKPLPCSEHPHLAVFNYFRPWLVGQKVVIIGRYPHMDKVLKGIDYQVLERAPQQDDLPDSAAEFLLPTADWVFITSTSIINKTFPRLSELSKNAVSVLMGPSTPWLGQFSQCDIDFLAGVVPVNTEKAVQIAAEGGGIALFGEGVGYALANISQERLAYLKAHISRHFDERAKLKAAMETWYSQGNSSRFPDFNRLAHIDDELAVLDLAYKRLWLANQNR